MTCCLIHSLKANREAKCVAYQDPVSAVVVQQRGSRLTTACLDPTLPNLSELQPHEVKEELDAFSHL